ncbi:hypothetical protein MUK70_30420 [Dyadobacter chenwenxiniae]|uniref:Uncharacterized protein n=1 Tax=Dyadobacter chenwenxiniae TaxID=2906456 RepID=A0A9X1PMI6_9BACT|nr:hypothetical protein [Dyadobacter chenwenxiniae]MCF0063638.1 hypothetical protein [Dyadobacter chenwenxiniae]UON83314.1 hypothetical protein MUK70_30420 [Dyadobacter chenwenxiniae]
MKRNSPMSENAKAIPEKETEENLDKMAKKLSKEWSKPSKTGKVPDLSFSKFEEKLKNKDQ